MPTWLNHWCCLNVESLWMKHSTLDLAEVQTRAPHKSTRLMSLEPLNQWPLSSTWPCKWWFLHCTRNLGRNRYDGVASALPFYLVLHLNHSSPPRTYHIISLIKSEDPNLNSSRIGRDITVVKLSESCMSSSFIFSFKNHPSSSMCIYIYRASRQNELG